MISLSTNIHLTLCVGDEIAILLRLQSHGNEYMLYKLRHLCLMVFLHGFRTLSKFIPILYIANFCLKVVSLIYYTFSSIKDIDSKVFEACGLSEPEPCSD